MQRRRVMWKGGTCNGSTCPTVVDPGDGSGEVWIVGRPLDPAEAVTIGQHIGPGELALRVPREALDAE